MRANCDFGEFLGYLGSCVAAVATVADVYKRQLAINLFLFRLAVRILRSSHRAIRDCSSSRACLLYTSISAPLVRLFRTRKVTPAVDAAVDIDPMDLL